MTTADHAIRAKVNDLHVGDEPPKVTFQVWASEVPLA
jgi:hypothetical protein